MHGKLGLSDFALLFVCICLVLLISARCVTRNPCGCSCSCSCSSICNRRAHPQAPMKSPQASKLLFKPEVDLAPMANANHKELAQFSRIVDFTKRQSSNNNKSSTVDDSNTASYKEV